MGVRWGFFLFLPNDYSPIVSNVFELHLQALELKKSENYDPNINKQKHIHASALNN